MMKPISNDASPRTCHGVGPSSVPAIRIANSTVEPVRTPNIAVISAMNLNGLNWMRTSRPTKPKMLKNDDPVHHLDAGAELHGV